MNILLEALLMGVIATLLMDFWALFAKHSLHLPTADWALVGRWFGYIPKGTLIHRPISATAPLPKELLIGWVAHYLTGVLYGLLYLFIIRVAFKSDPTLVSALSFGLATLVAPWLVMQPAMGAGWFAARTPRPGTMRMVNLSMHAVFGASLYIGWLLLN